MKINRKRFYLPEIIGNGYATFWNFRGRYRVCKGSRASKKSKTTAINFIHNIMKYPDSNLLVVRKVFRTLKDSCWTDLKWAVHRLGADDYWEFTASPLEATYIPTGQKIYFRGLDDPLKITSIAVEKGVLCWLWIEEAYEIMSEADFDMLNESIRGECPAGLWKQVTITLNPWNERHWIKHRFFDVITGYDSEGAPVYKARKNPISDDGDTLAITTNYLCNEFLDAADHKVFEDMKINNPRRYKVAGLGDWGIVEGLVFENWKEEIFDIKDPEFQKNHPQLRTRCGMDFGYTNDPTAVPIMFLDLQHNQLFIWDEIYKTGLTNKMIFDEIKKAGYLKERYTADCAEPKSIDELKTLGLNVKGAKKGRDSINNGIQWLQGLQIIIHPRCVNFLTEISNYTWDTDKFGKKLNVPIDDFNHLMDAMRYGVEQDITGNKKVRTRKIIL